MAEIDPNALTHYAPIPGFPEGRDEAMRERQALADADGRKEYSAAELTADHEAGADLPYLDVLALGDRGADQLADEAEKPAEQRAEEAPGPGDATVDVEEKAEAAAQAEDQAVAAHEEAEAEGRRNALEAERDRINAELEGTDGGQ